MEQMAHEGLESCNLKHRQSSASRGVRSRQQQEVDLFAPVKVETIPLLTPNMESELMREPWTFPREPASCVVVPVPVPSTVTAIEEDASATPFSTWEENFQDLSGWCTANIQPRCDFHIGESTMASKITGTRNEGSDVLFAAEGVTRGLMQMIGKKNLISGDAMVGAHRPELATCVVSPHDQTYPMVGHQQQHQQIYYNNNNNTGNSNDRSNINNNNNSNNVNTKIDSNEVNELKSNLNVWMGLPTKPIDNNSVAWQTLSELGITPVSNELPVYHQQNPIMNLETKQEQRQENQEVFEPLETDASDGFDLLSYLLEDDIPSPVDSVSTDSSRVTDVNSLPRLSSNSSAHVVVSPKTYEPVTPSPSTSSDALKSRLQLSDSPYSHESPKDSPLSTTSSEVTTRSSSYQLRPTTMIKLERPESPPMERRTTRQRQVRTISVSSRSRKRTINESDSDDESYRETREKNNEASRKSRMNKKAKEMEMAKRAIDLEKDNRILKMKVEELEKLVSSMRSALLRSALKREVKTNMF